MFFNVLLEYVMKVELLPLTSVSSGELVSAFLPEPNGSGFGLFVYGWNHSDSAAHAKLLVQSQSK